MHADWAHERETPRIQNEAELWLRGSCLSSTGGHKTPLSRPICKGGLWHHLVVGAGKDSHPF